MNDKKIERMINAAGLIGVIIGFVSGVGVLALLGIIF